MRQTYYLRSILFFLLAAVLIAAGAFLPRLVARWQDSGNEAGYAPIDPVSLTFNEKPSIREKISGFSGGEMMEVPEDLASHTPEEIRDIFSQTLDKYIAAGLMQGPGKDGYGAEIYCTPYLAFSERTGESSLIWYASKITGEAMWSLILYIDDETGTVVSLDYYDLINKLPHQETLLEGFSGLYLEGLGEEFAEYDPQEILADAVYYNSPYVTSAINWGDALYGECFITFTVFDCGFNTYIG